MSRVGRALKDPEVLVGHMLDLAVFNGLPDYLYLEIRYRLCMGRRLNLTNPRYFNEKLQWLKLHNRNLFQSSLVDKYEVRRYVARTVGDNYLVPLIGVWDRFEDIDANALPDQFVMKCTHDSGSVLICRDKSTFDVEAARRRFGRLLKRNYYYPLREWPYRDVRPRIMCEQLIATKDEGLPIDYKFHCFNGYPDCVMVCVGRESGKTQFYYYDSEWRLLKYNMAGTNPAADPALPKPKRLDEMFKIAGALSDGFPYVRVDLYCEDERAYFGELTFFPQGGFDSHMLQQTDLLFGSKIELRTDS